MNSSSVADRWRSLTALVRTPMLVAALCLASAAQGATITVHPEDDNGRIFVDIAGEITLTDIKTFSDEIEHLPSEKVYVSLSSEGGVAVAGLFIGNYIRLSGMKTLVPEDKKCVSVCAIIWLGGSDRYVGGRNMAVGFHGVYNKNTGQPGSMMNRRIAVYLGYLELSYDAVEWILGGPPLAIRWLTPETSEQYDIDYSELTPKRSVAFVDEQGPNITPATPPPPQQSAAPQEHPVQPELPQQPPPQQSTAPQEHPVQPELPQQPPQTTRGPKRPFRVVDVSDGFLQIRNGPGPTYQEIAKMPLGATGLVGRCVPLDGPWKPFCEVEWQGVSGWASSCCLAEFEETTQFSYRVTQNLFLRSGPDKSSWNMLTNYAPKDYIPEGKIFTWKRRPDAGNCTAGRGGEIWCQLTYTPDGGIRTDGWVSAHFLRSTTTQRLLACLFQNPCTDDGAAPFR
jgi:hypothetical protein